MLCDVRTPAHPSAGILAGGGLRRARTGRGLAAAALALAACLVASVAAAHERPAVDVLVQLEEALNQRDVDTAAALFAEDAVLRDGMSPPLRGPGEIRAWLRARVSGPASVHPGDVGLLEGSGSTLEWATDVAGAGGMSRRVRGHVAVQRGRVSLLALDTGDPPLVAAAEEPPPAPGRGGPLATGLVAIALAAAAYRRRRAWASTPAPPAPALKGRLVPGLRRWLIETGRASAR